MKQYRSSFNKRCLDQDFKSTFGAVN